MPSSTVAVRESPLVVPSAMSPAPTRIGAPALLSCTASESAPDNPAAFVTVTRTLSRPVALYTCDAVIGVDALVAVPLFELPSPHVTV